MKVQAVVLKNEVCNEASLYIRTQGQVDIEDYRITLSKEARCSTDTYMNAFDAGIWYRYTGTAFWQLHATFSGSGEIYLIRVNKGERQVCMRRSIQNVSQESFVFSFEHHSQTGIFFFELHTATELTAMNMFYSTAGEVRDNSVKLGLIICTYHRNTEIMHNLSVLRGSAFNMPEMELYEKMKVVVVDNGSELPEQESGYIRVVHNPNTGGSGGFGKGLKELRRYRERWGLTHVIFMDDDVLFLPETFYRLYALLALLKEEYTDAAVAGRMFRMDRRHIQYTAAEIWNKGDLRHIGFNCDMTLQTALETMNDNKEAEYGGWWLCCFPMEFARNNDPFPFFLHCDDVEYGLRHGGTPIILNGIQVWHETYEYRQNPVIAYYDFRNRMYVNQIYRLVLLEEENYHDWKAAISKAHVRKDYNLEYLLIKAFSDYLKGPKWLKRLDSECYHKALSKHKSGKLRNAAAWRMVACKFRLRSIFGRKGKE